MPGLPAALLTHTMLVEPYRGASGTGPVYGPAVTVPCFVEPARMSTRAPEERTATGKTTVYAQLDAHRHVTPEARVTLNGRLVEVVSVTRRDGGGLATPDHLEVTVQ